MLEILLQAEESQCVCEQGTSLSSSQRGELDSSGQRGFLQQADLSSGRVSESSQSLACGSSTPWEVVASPTLGHLEAGQLVTCSSLT